MSMYRQGDVLFRTIQAIPGGCTRRTGGRILEGEATGHVHRIAEDALDCATLWAGENKLFLSVTERGISIIHEEHQPLVLPPGDYEIVRQREYSPDDIHSVAD